MSSGGSCWSAGLGFDPPPDYLRLAGSEQANHKVGRVCRTALRPRLDHAPPDGLALGGRAGARIRLDLLLRARRSVEAAQPGRARLANVVRLERPGLAHEQLIRQHPQRPQVTCRAAAAAAKLLWRHVLRRWSAGGGA